MQIDQMPSLGDFPGAHQLRSRIFQALTYTRVQADVQPDSTRGRELATFLREVAKLCPQPVKQKEPA